MGVVDGGIELMLEYCERNNVPYTDSKQDLVIELAKIIYGISCFLLPDQKDADSKSSNEVVGPAKTTGGRNGNKTSVQHTNSGFGTEVIGWSSES
ncbi:MAG: hypothetical protein FMNOHCHN_03576 [Ignavibacteriaceae bacterium]|nr:hypothetical protein [Ignavibacteriaceae bacterium]